MTRDELNAETARELRAIRRSIIAAGPQEVARAASDTLRMEDEVAWARYYHRRLPEGAERMRRSRTP